ncbi:hypothetical protein M2407_001772 [Serratia sp. BIGb0234]|nr:hypothetical protein [Serratia sp. BIGb0234]
MGFGFWMQNFSKDETSVWPGRESVWISKIIVR